MNNTSGTLSIGTHYEAGRHELGDLNNPLTWDRLRAYIMDDVETMSHGDIQGYSVFVECDSKEACDD